MSALHAQRTLSAQDLEAASSALRVLALSAAQAEPALLILILFVKVGPASNALISLTARSSDLLSLAVMGSAKIAINNQTVHLCPLHSALLQESVVPVV